MALLRKNGNNLDVISPSFYRTWVGTSSAYEQQKNSIPNGTLIYITDDTSSQSSLESVYPIGSIYLSTVSTNPNDLFGFGTWISLGNDYYLKSIGSGESALDEVGSNTKTLVTNNIPSHTHTVTPSGTVTSTFVGTSSSHTHTVLQNTGSSDYDVVVSRGKGTSNCGGIALPNDSGTKALYSTNGNGNTLIGSASLTPSGTVTSTFTGTSGNTGSSGSGASFDIKPKSLCVYMWRRTA